VVAAGIRQHREKVNSGVVGDNSIGVRKIRIAAKNPSSGRGVMG